MQPQFCPKCKAPILPVYHFCPNCGVSLEPINVSIFKQIGVYLVSVLLPPLGLWPGFRYIKGGNDKTKIVGIVAIILTLISTVLTIWFTIGVFQNLAGKYGSQFDQLKQIQQNQQDSHFQDLGL